MASLSYANVNSGKLAYAIGWLNWGTRSFPAGMAPITLTYSLQGNVTLTFTVDATGSGTGVATGIPTWSGSAMGNLGYTGISGNCAIAVFGTTGFSIDISNIALMDFYGNLIDSYAFYSADAEATNNTNEFLVFTSDTSLTQADVYPTNYPCPPYVGGGVLPVTIGGACSGTAYNSRIFQSASTANYSSKMITPTGQEAMAIGFSFQQIQLQKYVTGRIDSTDQFDIALTSSIVNLSTITTGTLPGIQGESLYDYGNIDDIYTINETMAPGSASSLTQYVQTISIVNTAGGSIPSGVVLGGTIPLNVGDFLVVKIVNTPIVPYIKPIKIAPTTSFQGDKITYIIVLPNTSPNIAINTVLVDTAPDGTTFIPNSVFINGQGTSETLPNINVGTIPANSITTVTFDVLVNSVTPKITPINNSATVKYSYPLVGGSPNLIYSSSIVSTNIADRAYLSGVKSVDKSMAKFGEILTYTVVYTNTGNATAENLIFIDTIPSEVTFINDSVKVNSAVKTGVSPIPPGFSVTIPSTLLAGQSVTISFDVMVNTLVNPTTISNNGEMAYSYQVGTVTYSNAIDTNTITTLVEYLDMNINKVVDNVYSTTGNTISYTIIINSIGNVQGDNLIIVDTLPNSVTLVPGSIIYDGNPISGDLQSGINLGSTAPIATHTLIYQVYIN